MKILFATHLYPPAGIGGTEVYTHGLAKGLLEAGHEVQVLCADDWERGPRYWSAPTDRVHDGVPVRGLHLDWTKARDVNRSLYDNPVIADYLAGWLGELGPDVVHVTSCATLSASVVAAAKRAGVPVVVSLTDFWFICPQVGLLRSDGQACDARVPASECLRCRMRGTKAYRWVAGLVPDAQALRLLGAVSRHGALTRWPGLRGMALDMDDRRAVTRDALARADRVLIGSEHARRMFANGGVTRPIDVVRYGHDLRWLEDYRGKSPAATVRFGFIGQVAPLKGVHVLIEAFDRACRVGDARLLIYGNLDKDPAYGARLRSMAGERPDVEFRGTYAHTDGSRVFSEIDVLVVPSLWPDYPLVISEAFAARTPVIATDLGGMSEFVEDGVSGLLFERGSVAGLARLIRRVVGEPELLGRLAAGVPRVKTMRDAVAEMEGIYRELPRAAGRG